LKECKKCHASFPDDEVRKHPSAFVEVCQKCYAECDAIDAETKRIWEEKRKAEKERIIASANAGPDLSGYEHVTEEKDPLEALLDEEFARQLKEKHDRETLEKIEKFQKEKLGRYSNLKARLKYAPVMSKVEGDLYCQVCGGKQIAKAGIMFKQTEKVQKWKCANCGYVFTKYHENVRIV